MRQPATPWSLAARAALLLVALAAIALGLGRLHATRACSSDSTAAFAVGLGAPATHIDALVHGIEAHCRGGSALASAAVALQRAGHAAGAQRVAAEAVRREPDSYLPWFVLAVVHEHDAPVTAALELARAHALNPRYAAALPSVDPATAGRPLVARNPARARSGAQ